jgi:hypothetical protein
MTAPTRLVLHCLDPIRWVWGLGRPAIQNPTSNSSHFNFSSPYLSGEGALPLQYSQHNLKPGITGSGG